MKCRDTTGQIENRKRLFLTAASLVLSVASRSPMVMDPVPSLLIFELHQRLILHLVSAVGEGSHLLFSSKTMLWCIFQTKNFLLNLNFKATPDLKEILRDLPHLPRFCSQFFKIFLTFCIDFSLVG